MTREQIQKEMRAPNNNLKKGEFLGTNQIKSYPSGKARNQKSAGLDNDSL